MDHALLISIMQNPHPHFLLCLQFSCSVVSNSLWPHGPQHARLPCRSPAPRACPNSCPSGQWCHSTISFSVVPFFIFPSIRVFSNESVLWIRWPKDWSFSISPSNEKSGLISFRIDWFDLFAIQGTLKSLLQHHSSKVSISKHLLILLPNHSLRNVLWSYRDFLQGMSPFSFHFFLLRLSLTSNTVLSAFPNPLCCCPSNNPVKAPAQAPSSWISHPCPHLCCQILSEEDSPEDWCHWNALVSHPLGPPHHPSPPLLP